jgi:sulfite exporter TauE/SafE
MIFWTAIILGLAGSLHCAGMCGPLALAVPVVSTTRAEFIAGRLAYNFGRMLTYCVLGVVFGLVGRTLVLAGVQRWASIALGIALLLGLISSRKLAVWQPVTALIGRLKSSMAALLNQRSHIAVMSLGFLNGFLPCGLVYVACAGASTAGSVASGMLYMAAFGLGTFPMMLGIGLSGQLMPTGVRLQLRKAIPVCVFLLGSLLILRGLSLGIPYLSPDLSSGTPPCCHK